MKYMLKKAFTEPGSIPRYLKRLFKKMFVRRVSRDGKIFYEYGGEFYPQYLSKGNAISFIQDKAETICKGKGLDIGASRWPLTGAMPVRNEQGQNAYQLDNITDNSLDYVFSSHCLEHLEQWREALKLWTGKLKSGGILFLYLPHESMKLWHPEAPWGSHHKWTPNTTIINEYLGSIGLDIVEYSPEKDQYWSFYIVARKA
jgi:SAM-dependent methyltransferase